MKMIQRRPDWNGNRPASYEKLGLDWEGQRALGKSESDLGYVIALRTDYRNFDECHRKFKRESVFCGCREYPPRTREQFIDCGWANEESTVL